MGGYRVWTEAPLPFDRLSPVDFERLIFALLGAEGHSGIRHWGGSGDRGIDLISVDKDGRRVATQCKRVTSFGPTSAKTELRKVLERPPSPHVETWLLVASCRLSRKTEERLVATAAGALKVEIWGQTELDRRLRQHPDLIEWYFGPALGAAVEPPLWWLSAAPADRAWAKVFAKDLLTCLCHRCLDTRLELAVPSEATPWPEVPPNARWGLVIVTPEALADPRLRRIWQGELCSPCRSGGPRRLLALALEPAPWPPWLEERFERFELTEDYRKDLTEIISKYIDETGKEPVSGLSGPGPRARRLPAALRERLIGWLEPVMSRPAMARLLASALRLEHRRILDDFESPALRASAALVLATGGDDPIEAALRTVGALQDELTEEETAERLAALAAIAGELRRSRVAPSERDDLRTAWLKKVAADHRRLVDHFQQRHELDLLDRVYVELEMAPELEAERISWGTPGDDGDAGWRRSWKIRELLALDPANHPWVTRRWLVRGDPGSGKTTLLRHLAARLATGSAPALDLVPVFQSLPVLIRDGRPLLDRLERMLGRAQHQGLKRALDHIGEQGRLLVLLDGLDEVDQEEREDAETLIWQLAERWPDTPIVVTTRPIGYRRFAADFRELELQPLDRERRRDFLARWFGRFDGTINEMRAEQALRELDDPGFEELAGNPLYLTLMALLLEDGKSPARNRSVLYDQVFHLLLEGKHKLGIREGGFKPIDRPELVRRVLHLLAESMTLDNCDAEPRRELEERLFRDDLERERFEMRKVQRWGGKPKRFLDDAAEKVGILGPHDGEDADWRFWHRTFREALAAERMASWGTERQLEHARAVEGQESRWAEPFALLCGRADDADALLRRLLDANRPLALRALATAQAVSEATVEAVLNLTGNWNQRSKVYEQLPELIGDGDRCLRLIDRLRNGRRDGNDLFFLDRAAWLAGERWPEYADAARRLRSRLFDHIPPLDDPSRLFRWRRPSGEMADLWCRIPAGGGWIGEVEDEVAQDRESPRYRMEIERPFWLSAIPVTNMLYVAFDNSNRPHAFAGVTSDHLRDHPRVNVTWYEAVSFCRWLATQPGFAGTAPSLPEEELWEYACRAGSAALFWRGDSDEDLAEVGWYLGNAGGRTHRVGGRPANALTLHDVHGNVSEWTATEWDQKRHQGRGQEEVHRIDPAMPAADLAIDPQLKRVIRGGSCGVVAHSCRSAARRSLDPWKGFWDQGFRVLLASAPSPKPQVR